MLVMWVHCHCAEASAHGTASTRMHVYVSVPKTSKVPKSLSEREVMLRMVINVM